MEAKLFVEFGGVGDDFSQAVAHLGDAFGMPVEESADAVAFVAGGDTTYLAA